VHPRNSQSEAKEKKWLKDNWPGEEVGCGRKYETMVFLVTGECSCGCGLPAMQGNELEMAGYNTAKDAAAGHHQMCEKWASIESVEKSEQ
jgi:hypothetical protein